MQTIKVTIEKPISEQNIREYEERVVMYAAAWTREYTKNLNAFPKLTGELERQEYKAPIVQRGNGAQACLLEGVSYARYVYKMKQNSHWTNENTLAHWYGNVYKKYEKEIVEKAKTSAAVNTKKFYPHGNH